MAKILSSAGMTTGQAVTAAQQSQSIDAFTGADAYDITISGSLVVTGSLIVTGSLTTDTLTAGTITNILTTNITASGNISSSGDLYGTQLHINDNLLIYKPDLTTINYAADAANWTSLNIGRAGTSTQQINLNGQVTASANISSSATVEALTIIGSHNAVAESTSGGAISTAMTTATYPRNTIVSITQTAGSSNSVLYTLPEVEAGLEYTFIATVTSTGIETTRFSAGSSIMNGIIMASDANEVVTGAEILTITGGNFTIGTRIHFICDGTIWHVAAFFPNATGRISAS